MMQSHPPKKSFHSSQQAPVTRAAQLTTPPRSWLISNTHKRPYTTMEPSISNQAVVFTTQTPYPLPSQKYMIPTIWRRYHLSQLVNKALGLTKPIPFDFLVKGEILRTTIAEWCAEKGVGEVSCPMRVMNCKENEDLNYYILRKKR